MNRPHRPGDRSRTPARAGTARVAARPDVHIDIRELSLQGFSRAEQQRFVQALSEALGQQAAARQDWAAWSSQDRGPLPALQIHAGGSAEESARVLARELFACLAATHAEGRHG